MSDTRDRLVSPLWAWWLIGSLFTGMLIYAGNRAVTAPLPSGIAGAEIHTALRSNNSVLHTAAVRRAPCLVAIL